MSDALSSRENLEWYDDTRLPRIVRNDWFHCHDYTLWLTDSVQMRLSPEQYANLRASVDAITEFEKPMGADDALMTADEVDALLKQIGRGRG